MVKHDGGNIAIITALCLLPLTVLVGMSIDLSNATRVRVALQDAADSAALAMARNIDSIDPADVNTAAKNYIAASFTKNATYTATGTADKTTMTVTVSATAQVPTLFAGLLGVTKIPVSAYSEVKGQGYDYEIALVLDNSGSMGNTLGSSSTKLAELKTATKALFDAMLTTANAGKVKIGIVPFASSVNVGAANKTAAWLDTTGVNSASQYENFAVTTKTRMDLFSSSTGGMKSVSWGGCVESRWAMSGVATGTAWDLDILDTVPTTTKPETLFTPWFAPDEPDSRDSSYSDTYTNNYLVDDPKGCSGTPTTPAEKQSGICKYNGKTPDTSGGKGPNYLCTTTAVTDLTATRSTLDAAITAMAADGNTNILEGVMWGWRLLSPTEPFTTGKAYGTSRLTKVIILMTDGENNVPGRNTQNNSVYSSYGYTVKGHMGTTSNNTATINTKMDERTKLACANAKGAGVVIYTVGLGNSGDVNTTLLTDCASQASYAYFPTKGSDLTPVFQAIAASINKLRLAK